MLKRIFIIGLFTGFGQLYSIFVLKLIANLDSARPSVEIAQLDSLFFFIITTIAFGLQSAAIRDLALAKNWKQEYHQVQSARITFGILLALAALAAMLNKYYIIFLLAPVIAFSGEYALYARGSAIFGSIISFLRLTIPFSCVLVSAYYFPAYTGMAYVVSLFIVHSFTSLLISRYLEVPLFFKVDFSKLKLFYQSLPLGLVTLSLYFIGLGLMLVAPYFYADTKLGIVFAGLKFYVLYKGVLRIIHQAFVQDMTSEVVCLKVDQLSIMLCLLFLQSAFFFPDSFVRFFFGPQALAEKNYFQLLAVAALFYSIYLSMSTSALLQKKDLPYSVVTVAAAVVAIAAVVLFSYYQAAPFALGMSVCIGELVWVGGLIGIATDRKRILKRLLFLAEISILFIIPFALRYFMGDKAVYYFSSLVLVSLILLILHHRKFRL